MSTNLGINGTTINTVEHLLSARHDAYHAVADIVVDTSQSFDAATQKIADEYQSWSKTNNT